MNVTVLTCDKYYERTMPLFRRFFAKHWPGQAFAVVSDEPREGVDFASGPGTWSEMLIAYARHAIVTQETSVLLLDDYLLVEPIDAAKVALCGSYLAARGVGFVRLNPCPGPTLDFDSFIGEFARDADYLLSLQPCIWRWECLLDVLLPHESPWDFEIIGSKRAGATRWKFLGTRANLVSVNELMCRGEYRPETLAWVERQE